MSDEKRVSKYLKYSEQEDNDYYENERQQEEELIYQEEKEQEYYEDTIEIIQKVLISFVQEKSLTLCEYLDTTSIDNFIDRNCTY
jgi:FtsZ-interacting cell division protein YlmF